MSRPAIIERDERSRFVTGNIGGPGRPQGSRNKLGEAFVTDLLKDWQANGAKVIVQVRDERPADYLRVVASVLPKELIVTVNEYDDLSEDDLAQRAAAVVAQLGYGGRTNRMGASEAQTEARIPAKPH